MYYTYMLVRDEAYSIRPEGLSLRLSVFATHAAS